MILDLHLEVTGIKESRRGVSKDGSVPWRYMLAFKQKSSNPCQEAVEDLKALSTDNEKRCFRISLINRHCPSLVSQPQTSSVKHGKPRKTNKTSSSTVMDSDGSFSSKKITSYFKKSSGTPSRQSVGQREVMPTSSRPLQKLYSSSLLSTSSTQDVPTNVGHVTHTSRLSHVTESSIGTPTRSNKISIIDMSSATRSQPRMKAISTIDLTISSLPSVNVCEQTEEREAVEGSDKQGTKAAGHSEVVLGNSAGSRHLHQIDTPMNKPSLIFPSGELLGSEVGISNEDSLSPRRISTVDLLSSGSS